MLFRTHLDPTPDYGIVVERSPYMRGFAADCPYHILFKPSRLSFPTALWWMCLTGDSSN
jgi:hypothetical protein